MTTSNHPENLKTNEAHDLGQISTNVDLDFVKQQVVIEYNAQKAKSENWEQPSWQRETSVGSMWALSYVIGLLQITEEELKNYGSQS